MGEELVSVNEASAVLGISPRRIRALLQRGQLRGALAHPRFYLLKRADVEAFAKRDRPPGRPRMATDDAK